MRFPLLLVKLTFLAVLPSVTVFAQDPEMVRHFDYDKSAPRAYAQIVSEPKRFKLYEAPHALNAEARRDRIAFLTEQLKLKTLPPKVIDSIPELYQPPRPN